MKSHVLRSCAASLLMLSLLSVLACGHTTVWGHPPREFTDLVRQGRLPQFEEENFSTLPLDELQRLEPGAAYFLSHHDFKDESASLMLLEEELYRGEEPFAYEALLRLADLHSAAEAYDELIRLDQRYGEAYYGRSGWRRRALEAYYWAREDQTAYDRVDQYRRRFPDLARNDGELKLIETVLMQRLSMPDWQAAVLDLFRDLPAGAYHIRLHDYLRLEELLTLFSAQEQRFLRAVDLQARGEAEAAYAELKDLIREQEYLGVGSLATLVSSAAGAGKLDDSLALLRSLEKMEGLSSDLRREIDIQSAFLLRTAGRHREAETLFTRLSLEGDPEDTATAERFRWYAFSSLVRSSPAEAVRRLPWLLMSLDDPDYYRDVLDELASRLAVTEAWELLAEAYRYLDGAVPASILRRYAYLSARAREEGLFSQALDLPAHLILERLAEGAYPGAGDYPDLSEFGPDYYRIAAALYLGQDPPRFYNGRLESEAGHPGDILVEGFVRYGLAAEAGARASLEDVSSAAAERAARAMGDLGLHDQALRLLLRRRVPAGADSFYPRPFREATESAADLEDLPPWLLFALIREESLFNPLARSYVGAVGLTQLMPATAADVARRLRLESPDLTDPGTNLIIGSWYLRHMLDRSENLPDALAAYNAGITRARRWRRERGGLAGDLFIETIPFDETRAYLKRLLVSSYHYGYLYYRLDPDKLSELFFPDWR